MPKVRGSGSIIQLDKDVPRAKCRHWMLQVSSGRNLATGKYDRSTRRFAGTYSDAQKALREFISEIEKDTIKKNTKLTFNEYADSWLAYRSKTMAYSTYMRDADRLKCARLHIGAAYMNEITPRILEQMYQALQNGKSPSGKKLSGTYVVNIATTLHTMFRDARRDGIIAINPCDDARRPKLDTPERKSLNVENIHKIVNKLDASEPCQLAILLCIKTGMRRGEAHGLSWRDITDEYIYIRHSYDDGGNLKPPKTRKSMRTLPITDSVKADLDQAKQRALKLGLPTTEDSPVIINEIGERVMPHSTSRWWSRHRSELGFDGWTVHELRHSYLSELARRGVNPRVLQEIAGHESYKTTEEIYVHIKDEQMREAVKNVDW